MGDTTGFLKHARELPDRREVPVRLKDWREVYEDFLIAKVMTQDDGATAPVYLQTLQGGATGVEYGLQAALAVLLIIPPAIFGLAIQRYLVRGLTFGAIKQ